MSAIGQVLSFTSPDTQAIKNPPKRVNLIAFIIILASYTDFFSFGLILDQQVRCRTGQI